MNNVEEISKSELQKVRIDRAIRRKIVKKTLWALGILVIFVGLVAGWIQYSKVQGQGLPGKLIPDQGREHVGANHEHTYNSNPPTSGWHFSQPEEWGVYKEELPDETLIHNLEHGGIWISYKPDISEDIRKKLESFYEKFGRKIIVTPRAKNDSDVALAAWNRLDKFSVSEYLDERVEKFIKAFRNKGPEFVP